MWESEAYQCQAVEVEGAMKEMEKRGPDSWTMQAVGKTKLMKVVESSQESTALLLRLEG